MHIHAVASLKQTRQRALADLIRADALDSQDELAERLGALGFATTQATISRDLEAIGAIKVRRDGRSSYGLPDQPQPAASRMAAVLRDWAQSIEPAASLVVIKTAPGSAHLVGVVLDQSELPEIVGTICGDDTIFIACRTARDAASLARELRAVLLP